MPGQRIENFKKLGIAVLETAPAGWKPIKNAQTAPNGFVWFSNGKSRFKPGYAHCLVKTEDEPMDLTKLKEE